MGHPGTLPSVSTKDFVEIDHNILNDSKEDKFMPISHGPGPPRGGSGRIEDACGESPAASLDGVFSMRLRFIIRTLCGHYANRSIQERHYGFLERFLGLLGGVGGIWEGLGGLLESSWEVLGWSWGVLGRSWGGPGGWLPDQALGKN